MAELGQGHRGDEGKEGEAGAPGFNGIKRAVKVITNTTTGVGGIPNGPGNTTGLETTDDGDYITTTFITGRSVDPDALVFIPRPIWEFPNPWMLIRCYAYVYQSFGWVSVVPPGSALQYCIPGVGAWRFSVEDYDVVRPPDPNDWSYGMGKTLFGFWPYNTHPTPSYAFPAAGTVGYPWSVEADYFDHQWHGSHTWPAVTQQWGWHFGGPYQIFGPSKIWWEYGHATGDWYGLGTDGYLVLVLLYKEIDDG